MQGARTQGHDAALAAVGDLLRDGPPHALILSGAANVGKTTLALDVAAALFCTDPDPASRPCGTCRACRLAMQGTHADLHRLRPEGPGRQIGIGRREPTPTRGVRDLVSELSLMPMEGGARVAVIEHADRMNDEAQGALLKTLEEPPDRVTIVLCADDPERLLPTIRSRAMHVRLGRAGVRAMEAVLQEQLGMEPGRAARLARIAGGRPGLALAYARSEDADRRRGELTRTLLDLLAAPSSVRLAAMRDLLPVAMALAGDLGAAIADGDREVPPAPEQPRQRRVPSGARTTATVDAPPAADGAPGEAAGNDDPDADDEATAKAPPVKRRAGAELLTEVWIELARDLALAGVGASAAIRNVDVLEEIEAAARDLPEGAATQALERLERTGVLLAGNVNPELALDGALLAWPRRRVAAA